MKRKIQLVCPCCESRFDETLAGNGCLGCALRLGCGKVVCPYCGEEFFSPTRKWVRGGVKHGDRGEQGR